MHKFKRICVWCVFLSGCLFKSKPLGVYSKNTTARINHTQESCCAAAMVLCGYELHKLDTTLYCGYQQKKVLPQKRSSAQCKHKHMSNAFGVLQYRNLPHVLTALRTVHNAPRSIRVKFDICVFRQRQRELRGTGAVVWIIFFIASCVVVFLRLCFCGSAAVARCWCSCSF